MELGAWQEISIVVGLMCVAVGAVWRLQTQINMLARELDAFRVQVAQTYVTAQAMREMEDRISSAIHGLCERIDRVIDRRAN